MALPINIARGLGNAFAALESALSTPENFSVLISRLGWEVQLDDDQMALVNSVMGVSGDLGSLANALTALENDSSDAKAAVVTEAVVALILSLEDLLTEPLENIASLPEPLNEEIFWREQLVPPLIDLLLTDVIAENASALAGFMRLFGLAEPGQTEGDLWYITSDRLRWDRLLPAITDPLGHLKTIYGWGGDLQTAAIAHALNEFARRLGLTVYDAALPQALKDRFYPDVPDYACPRVLEVRVIDSGLVRAGLRILPVNTEAEVGIYVGPFVIGSADVSVNRAPGLDVEMSGSAGVDVAGIFLSTDGKRESIGSAASYEQEFRLIWQPDPPQVLIGSQTGARLELVDGEFTVTFKGLSANPEVEIALGGYNIGARLVLNPADSDSFLSELLHNVKLNANLAPRLVLSSSGTLTVEGSVGLELIVPLNLDLLFFTLSELYAALTLGTDDVDLTGALTFSAELPPFTFTVKRIGLTTTVTPDEDSTATGFGGLDVALAFKPPEGVGVGFDFLGIVYGGGYIDYYPETGEYNGIISVEILTIGITAILIITTKPPDNPDGWSLFVSINVDLGGIPLGFGFTLNKVGGLIGVHRTVDIPALQSGIRTGVLDSILFPDDPIANAPRILSDIATVFPIAQGSFVVGAMLQIGWGVPSIITADLGLIVQVPEIIIALIGQAETVLPFDDFALIEIHFDVVGVLDLAAGTLAIDAGLRDSHIVGYVLTGQMALRASFLTDPSFLLSIGGFHPAFPPPDAFPILDRMGVGISLGDWLSISFEAYLALTSNTVQFGAGLYLTASLIGFKIEGGTDINTLIQFVPFRFQSDLRFYITVSAAGVELMGVLLTGHVSGPNPYFVRGQAQFKILGLQKEVDIEETIGGETDIDDIDEVPLLDEVIAALEDPESWSAVDEGARLGGVLLAGISDATVSPVVHPGGKASVIQRVAPLDVELEHYGSAEIEGEDTLTISDVKVGGSASEWEFAEDWFAPAQFFDYTNDEKLSAPSFELMKGGLIFGDDESDAGTLADAVYNYQQIKHDPEFNVREASVANLYVPDTSALGTLTAQKAVRLGTKSPTVNTAGQTFTLKAARYVVVDRESLTTPAGTPTRTMTYAEAAQAVKNAGSEQIVVTSSERQSL
jgi:hypothetical protein